MKRGALVGSKKRKRRSASRTGKLQTEQPLGWHIRLELFRRQVLEKSPQILTVTLYGWELHMSYRPSARTPEGQLDPEPWSLTAHPASERPDYAWLRQAAEFLGIPPADLAHLEARMEERRFSESLAVVSWTWAAPLTTKTLTQAAAPRHDEFDRLD